MDRPTAHREGGRVMKQEWNIETALAVVTAMGVLYIVLNLYSLAGEL